MVQLFQPRLTWSPSLVALAICLLIVNLSAFSAARGIPSHIRAVAANQRLESFRKRAQCEIPGNPDFYGAGIRLGIYLQWCTSWIANTFIQDEISNNLDTSTIFLLAVFISSVVSTSTRSIQSAEVLVVLHLCFGFIFSVLSIWGHRTVSSRDKSTRFSLPGSTIRITLILAISSYAVWFWCLGRTTLATSDCPVYTFLFTPLDADGQVKYYFEFSSALILLIYAILFCRELFEAFCFLIITGVWTCVLLTTTFWFGPSGFDDSKLKALLSDSDSEATSRNTTTEEITPSSPPNHDEQSERKPRSKIRQLIKVFQVIFKFTFKVTKTLFSFGWKFSKTFMVLFWSQVYEKGSIGLKRPDSAWWAFFVINLWIVLFRTLLQLVYALIWLEQPKANLIPLIAPPIFQHTMLHPVWKLKWKFYQVLSNRNVNLGLAALNFICLIWAIIAIELTLKWNNITGINDFRSTGQLIPLIIGAAGMLRVVLNISNMEAILSLTDTLMSLLDRDPEEHRPDNCDAYSLQDDTLAVFTQTIPLRRHSTSDIQSFSKKLRDDFEPDHGFNDDAGPFTTDDLDRLSLHSSLNGSSTAGEPVSDRYSLDPDSIGHGRSASEDDAHCNGSASLSRRSTSAIKPDNTMKPKLFRPTRIQPLPDDLFSKTMANTSEDRKSIEDTVSSERRSEPQGIGWAVTHPHRLLTMAWNADWKNVPHFRWLARVRRACEMVWDANREHVKEFRLWSADHPIYMPELIKAFQEKENSEADISETSKSETPSKHKRATTTPYYAAANEGRHHWPRRRRRPSGLQEAVMGRSLHGVLTGLLREAAWWSRLMPEPRIEVKAKELLIMVDRAKEIRRAKRMKEITPRQQHHQVRHLMAGIFNWTLTQNLSGPTDDTNTAVTQPSNTKKDANSATKTDDLSNQDILLLHIRHIQRTGSMMAETREEIRQKWKEKRLSD